MDNSILNILVSSSYFISSVFFILLVAGGPPRARRVGLVFGVAGFAAHTAKIALLFFTDEPLVGGLVKSLFLFSWFAVIALLSLESKTGKSALGTFVFTLAFTATVPSVIPFAGSGESSPVVAEPLIQTHIALVLLGQAFFFVAFVTAVLYLFREPRIKKGTLREGGEDFLPITALDRIQHKSLLYGFPFATLGLALGFVSASQLWGNNWVWGVKETLSVATWLIYAVLINCRFAYGWKGRKSSFGAIAGFIAIVAVFGASYHLIGG